MQKAVHHTRCLQDAASMQVKYILNHVDLRQLTQEFGKVKISKTEDMIKI